MTQMDLTTFEPVEQLGQESLVIEAVSMYQAFENVKDGRGKKGKRYPLALILTLVSLGKMTGETTIAGIVDWVNERKNELKRLLKWPKAFPTNKTYTDAIAKCDYQEVAKVIAQVIVRAREGKQRHDQLNQPIEQKEEKEEELIHIAVDGKALRGTRKHARENQPSVHLLSFYDCESGIVLDHFSVKKKE